MSEHCELRNLRSNEFPAANAGIPARCLGCLALAESGHTNAVVTDGPESYASAVEKVRADDADFDPEYADQFHSILFEKPDESIQRTALKEWGFDYDGADGVVIASQKIEFGCDVEQTPSL